MTPVTPTKYFMVMVLKRGVLGDGDTKVHWGEQISFSPKEAYQIPARTVVGLAFGPGGSPPYP